MNRSSDVGSIPTGSIIEELKARRDQIIGWAMSRGELPNADEQAEIEQLESRIRELIGAG